MAWLTANWFWLLVFIAFMWMHLGGHGAGRARSNDKGDGSEAEHGGANNAGGGHQH